MGSGGQSPAWRLVDLMGLTVRCFVAPAKYSSKYFLIQTPVGVLRSFLDVSLAIRTAQAKTSRVFFNVLSFTGIVWACACLLWGLAFRIVCRGIAYTRTQKMKVYLYVRTSEFEAPHPIPEDNIALNQALDLELQELQDYCDGKGWQVTETVIDYASPWHADFLDRQGGDELMSRLQKGDVMLVHTMERMFSSCYDACSTLERFKSACVRLHVADLGGDVTDSNLQMDVIAASRLFAGLEKRRSVERIKNVKQDQRRKGRYLGGSRPFGYMIHTNGRLIENPMEQKVLKRIMQLHSQGRSLRAIAAEVTTPVAPISFKTVQRILQRNV